MFPPFSLFEIYHQVQVMWELPMLASGSVISCVILRYFYLFFSQFCTPMVYGYVLALTSFPDLAILCVCLEWTLNWTVAVVSQNIHN